MKKNILLTFVILFLVLLNGCKDEDSPVNSSFTIENQINAAKPINTVTVWNYTSTGNKIGFDRSTSSISKINDAYAISGYLVVKSYNDFYFNLSTVKSIDVSPNSITLNY